MIEKGDVREGAIVYSADGEKLGKVRACEADSFIIEKGFFFPKDSIARYEDIADVSEDGIRMALGREAFATDARGAGERATTGADVRVPIAEEQLDVAKHDRQAGEVRLRKEVATEHERVDVPVAKERVHVERVPAERAAAEGEADFHRTTTSMPVREEEVEIRKRPVVKEEVRLRKDREIEHRAADADLRKERASIEGEGAGRATRGARDPGEDEH